MTAISFGPYPYTFLPGVLIGSAQVNADFAWACAQINALAGATVIAQVPNVFSDTAPVVDAGQVNANFAAIVAAVNAYVEATVLYPVPFTLIPGYVCNPAQVNADFAALRNAVNSLGAIAPPPPVTTNFVVAASAFSEMTGSVVSYSSSSGALVVDIASVPTPSATKFSSWVITAVTQINLAGTSAGNWSVTTGAQSATLAVNLGLSAGQTIMMGTNSNGAVNIAGTITSYDNSTGALVVNITYTQGTTPGAGNWFLQSPANAVLSGSVPTQAAAQWTSTTSLAMATGDLMFTVAANSINAVFNPAASMPVTVQCYSFQFATSTNGAAWTQTELGLPNASPYFQVPLIVGGNGTNYLFANMDEGACNVIAASISDPLSFTETTITAAAPETIIGGGGSATVFGITFDGVNGPVDFGLSLDGIHFTVYDVAGFTPTGALVAMGSIWIGLGWDQLAVSTNDGTSWAVVTPSKAAYWTAGATNGSLICLVGQADSDGTWWALTTDDGINFSANQVTTDSSAYLSYVAYNGIYFCIVDQNNGYTYTSATGGGPWTKTAIVPPGPGLTPNGFFGLVANGGTFGILWPTDGNGVQWLSTSINGRTWTAKSVPLPANGAAAMWASFGSSGNA